MALIFYLVASPLGELQPLLRAIIRRHQRQLLGRLLFNGRPSNRSVTGYTPPTTTSFITIKRWTDSCRREYDFPDNRRTAARLDTIVCGPARESAGDSFSSGRTTSSGEPETHHSRPVCIRLYALFTVVSGRKCYDNRDFIYFIRAVAETEKQHLSVVVVSWLVVVVSQSLRLVPCRCFVS